MSKDDGGAAFARAAGSGAVDPQAGLSRRQYAAIHLRVPASGTAWLDDMILRAERRDLAGAVLAGNIRGDTEGHEGELAGAAYRVADALLPERDKGRDPAQGDARESAENP